MSNIYNTFAKFLVSKFWRRFGNKFGGEIVRGGDAINRHVTHIHIEWDSANINLTGFEADLTAAVKKIDETPDSDIEL